MCIRDSCCSLANSKNYKPIIASAHQIYLLAGTAVFMGLMYGLLFGLIDVEDTHKYRMAVVALKEESYCCLLYTSPSPRDLSTSRMPSSA
eukprot:TRINITY_DN5273_c0_g1_i2.p4 TRINITY_DN5273_c0_g1~~TRINITY_DN5273_c0_g1_i2.p4  ORF type:complete len:101 (+),score=42.76 TRINITY_DN5273_c0_g1_i2:35-304(+)